MTRYDLEDSLPQIDGIVTALTDPPRAFLPVLKSASIKSSCEDFVVEEIPKYLPDGTGEHLFLWIEKRDVSAGAFVQHITRMFRIHERDVGVAGQKDRRAVTRQFVSVPVACRDRVREIETDGIRLLAVSAHGNKLRTGHLQGNRFRIVLRARVAPFGSNDVNSVRSRLQELSENGFPNYFGPQRFGFHGNTLRKGIQLIQNAPPSNGGRHRRRSRVNRFAISAVQSAIFNLVLARRVAASSFTSPVSGDVVCRRDGIRPFLFEDRGDTPAQDLVPMGPMPGPKMLPATGDIAHAETAILNSLGLPENAFAQSSKQAPGTRRKMVEYPTDCFAELTSDGSITISFQLPAGVFATVLLAELCGELVEPSNPQHQYRS